MVILFAFLCKIKNAEPIKNNNSNGHDWCGCTSTRGAKNYLTKGKGLLNQSIA